MKTIDEAMSSLVHALPAGVVISLGQDKKSLVVSNVKVVYSNYVMYNVLTALPLWWHGYWVWYV